MSRSADSQGENVDCTPRMPQLHSSSSLPSRRRHKVAPPPEPPLIHVPVLSPSRQSRSTTHAIAEQTAKPPPTACTTFAGQKASPERTNSGFDAVMNHLTALFDRDDADFDLGLEGMPAEIETIGNPRLVALGRIPDRDFPVSSKHPPPTVIDLTSNSVCESPTPTVNESVFAKGSQKPRMHVLPPSRRITSSMSKMQQ